MSKLVLNQIELSNFKSFRGDCTIGPFSPFSAIIGPNGAGKSNVLDALAFCLLLDPKPRSTNYIYSTPENPDAKSCFVRVTLQRISPKQDEQEFISFVHKLEIVSSDGDNVQFEDHFFVDSDEVEKEDYVKEIENCGITPLCFVKQTQVDEVARMSPQELTNLFENYSGSIKYAQQYEDLRIQLESAQQELSIIEKRRRTTQTEKQHLTKSQQEAKNYEELAKTLKETEIEFALFQLYYLRQKYEDAKEGRDELESQIEKDQAKVSEKEDRRKQVQVESNDIKDKLSQVDNQIQRFEQSIRDTRSRLASEEERKEFYAHSIIEKKNRIVSKQSTSEAYKEQVRQYQQKIAEIEEQLQTLPDPGALRADVSRYNSIRAQSSRLYSDISQELNAARSARQRAEDELNQITNDLVNANTSLTRTIETIENTKANQNDYTNYKKTEEQKKAEAEKNLKELTTQDDTDKRTRDKNMEELSKKQRQYDELKRTIGSSKRKERFFKTINNLKRLVPGVYGCLGQLYTPTKESYKKAISAGIGASMDDLVVKDREVGKRCLEYFKEQGAGIVTTIPLKGLEWKQKKLGNVMPLSKLINPISDEYKSVFEYVCRGIVYAKTYEEAEKLAFNHGYNVVTQDGVFFDHHGIITTGLANESTSYDINELTRLGDSISQLDRDIDKLNDAIEKRRPEIEKINEDIETFKSHIKEYNRKLSELADDLKQYESNRRTIEQRIRKLEKEQNDLEKVHQEKDEEYQRAQAKQDELDKKLFEDIKLESGQSIKEVEEKYNKRIALENKRNLYLDFIPSDDKIDPTEEIEELKKKLEDDTANKEIAENEINKLNDDINSKQKEISSLREQFSELRGNHEEIERELIQLNREIRSITESLDQDSSNLSIHEHELNTTKQQISAILQHCKLSNIPLPHTDEFEQQEITSTLSNESQIQGDFEEIEFIDFNKLSAANRSTRGKDYSEKVQRYESKIKKMQHDFSQSKPDLASSKKFEKIEKEIESMKKEADEADKLVKETKKEFKNVKENRRRLFMQLYDYLDTHINPIYQLFTQRHAGRDHGGVAYLAMEDTDEPYLGGIKFTAMPPHKRFRDLDQLSGGEKAIASLSLIITLQEYLKAPFVLLDEPDASLDKVNLSTAALALRNETQKESSDDSDSHGLQVICVSLSDKYFSTADALVGIYKESETQSSGVLTLSLQKYNETSLRMDEL